MNREAFPPPPSQDTVNAHQKEMQELLAEGGLTLKEMGAHISGQGALVREQDQVDAHAKEMQELHRQGPATAEDVDAGLKFTQKQYQHEQERNAQRNSANGEAAKDLLRQISGDPDFDRTVLHAQVYNPELGGGDGYSNPFRLTTAKNQRGADVRIFQETDSFIAEVEMFDSFLKAFKHSSREGLFKPGHPAYRSTADSTDSFKIYDQNGSLKPLHGDAVQENTAMVISGERNRLGILQNISIADYSAPDASQYDTKTGVRTRDESVLDHPTYIMFDGKHFEARFRGDNYALPEEDPRFPGNWNQERIKTYISERIMPLMSEHANRTVE